MANKEQDPLWLRILAELMLRLVYFSGAFLFIGFSLLGGTQYGAAVRLDTLAAPSTWLVVLALSALLAPYAYRKYAQRGRGALQQVRQRSKNSLAICAVP